MTMVEKMARAIDPKAWQNTDEYIAIKGYDATDANEVRGRSARIQASLVQAVAALKALREPSGGMVGHVVDTVFDGGIEDANLIPEIFTAAIDAAIQEHEGL